MQLSRRFILSGGSAAIIAGITPRSAWGKTEADVVIIGAGLAGLIAAYRLERAGQRVIIVEGEKRVGGRLHTLDDLPGRPEAGGIQVGSGYSLLRLIASDLKVDLTEGPGGGAGIAEARTALFNLGGSTITAADWPTAEVNKLAESERTILPLALGFSYGSKLPRLDSPESWLDAEPALDISYAAALRLAGASDEALRLIQANMNGNTLAEMSQINALRSAAIYRAGPGPTATISGGSQRLPEAMAAQIGASIRTGTVVTGISEDADAVTLSTSRGNIRARHCICTIPFSALRYVPISANLGPDISTLISSLPYTRASFAFLSATEPFWKTDGLPETLWTDAPLIGRVFVLGDNPPMLKLWTVGAGADLLDRMPPQDASAAIISKIEAARPSSVGKLKVEKLFSWQKSTMARGIYHHIGTGQAGRLSRAVRSVGHRLYFAGEHLSLNASGMEAALESGERVARQVISAS